MKVLKCCDILNQMEFTMAKHILYIFVILFYPCFYFVTMANGRRKASTTTTIQDSHDSYADSIHLHSLEVATSQFD